MTVDTVLIYSKHCLSWQWCKLLDYRTSLSTIVDISIGILTDPISDRIHVTAFHFQRFN